jgi:hypothetical protein
MAGTRVFELYANLLSDEARQTWEKIVKAQTKTAPWEDLKGTVHTEQGKKTWESFLHCVNFHLRTVFRHDAGELVKYYITNVLKKPNQVPVRQFIKRVEQLNSYLKMLLCLHYSPKANSAMKPVKPLDNSDLANQILHIFPIKLQCQYG